MRIDKYLWAVRQFKTRTSATDKVRDGKVEVGGVAVKPSREVKVGEEVVIRKGASMVSLEVLALPKSRIGPKLVEDYMKNTTPVEEREKALAIREAQRNSTFLQGRPTKKARRDWRKFME